MLFCIYCKKPRSPRSKKYCSRKCGNNAWSKQNRKQSDREWMSIRYRATKVRIDFLTREEFKKWTEDQDDSCFYCHIPKEKIDIVIKMGEERGMPMPIPWKISGNLQIDKKNPKKVLKEKRLQMSEAVKILDFATAAILRDEIKALEAIGLQKIKK